MGGLVGLGVGRGVFLDVFRSVRPAASTIDDEVSDKKIIVTGKPKKIVREVLVRNII